MKGFGYYDSVNNVIVKVIVRYPEDFDHCVGRPTVDDLVSYLHKHPDEYDYLVNQHDMKNRLFREQAHKAKQYKLAASESFQSKPCKDKSWDAKVKEIYDTPRP